MEDTRLLIPRNSVMEEPAPLTCLFSSNLFMAISDRKDKTVKLI